MSLADWARSCAEQHLAVALPSRWQHVCGVAAQAQRISVALNLPAEQTDLLIAAGYLHDIGYSPDLVKTGFHPLDGARYLRELGVDSRLCSLVAYHTAAVIEADLRGLAADLQSEFELEKSVLADALWYCDLTTTPNGGLSTVEDRIAEIQHRYGPGHLVTRFIDLARADLLAAADRIDQRIMSIESS